MTEQNTGHHRYIRNKTVNLDNVLCNSTQGNAGIPVWYLHIYCDELVGELSSDALNQTNSQLRYVHIYARNFLTNITSQRTISFAYKKYDGSPLLFKLAAFFQNGPIDVTFGHQSVGSSFFSMRRNASSTCAGLLLLRDGITKDEDKDPAPSKWGREIQNVPDSEVMPPSYELLAENTRHLFNLLTDMFKSACISIFKTDSEQQTAISMWRFILLCTRASPSASVLSAAAERLLSRLNYPVWSASVLNSFTAARQRFDVPVLKFGQYKAIVEPLIRFAKDQERLVSDSELSGIVSDVGRGLSDQAITNGRVLLNGMAETVASFTNIDASADRARAALVQAEQRRRDMQACVAILQARLKELEPKLNQKIEDAGDVAVKNLFKGIYKSLKSAASAGSGLAEGDVSGLFDFAETQIDETKARDKEAAVLKKFRKDIESFLKQSSALIDQMRRESEVQKLSANFNTNFDAARMLNSLCAYPLDYFGLITQYRNFGVDSARTLTTFDEALRELAEVYDEPDLGKLDGLDEFKDDLQKLIIAGTVTLEAQNQAQELIIAHLRAVCEAAARKEAQERIRGSANNLSAASFNDGSKARKQLADTLARETPLVKIQICVAFFDCLLSHIYRANLPGWAPGITVHSDMSASGYDTTLNKLEIRSNAADEAFRSVQTAAKPATLEVDVSKLTDFKTTGSFLFEMPLQAKGLWGYYNCRIEDIYAELDASGKTLEGVNYDVQIGPNFLDKTVSGEMLHFVIEPYSLHKIDKEGKWSGGVYFYPPVACTGEFSMPNDGAVDLSKVTMVRLMFKFKGVHDKRLRAKDESAEAAQ